MPVLDVTVKIIEKSETIFLLFCQILAQGPLDVDPGLDP